MIIDCGSCAVAGLACDDCVVTVLLGVPEQVGAASADPQHGADAQHGADRQHRADPRQPADLPDVAVDDEHVTALGVLADAGLVPPLRLVPRTRAS